MKEYAQAKAEREGKQADEGQATYSKAELDAMWAEVNTLKAERETLKGIVDSLKQPLEEHTAAADELWKKKSEKRRELVSPSLPTVPVFLQWQHPVHPSRPMPESCTGGTGHACHAAILICRQILSITSILLRRNTRTIAHLQMVP